MQNSHFETILIPITKYNMRKISQTEEKKLKSWDQKCPNYLILDILRIFLRKWANL